MHKIQLASNEIPEVNDVVTVLVNGVGHSAQVRVVLHKEDQVDVYLKVKDIPLLVRAILLVPGQEEG